MIRFCLHLFLEVSYGFVLSFIGRNDFLTKKETRFALKDFVLISISSVMHHLFGMKIHFVHFDTIQFKTVSKQFRDLLVHGAKNYMGKIFYIV